MNGELQLEGIAISLDSRPQRFVRIAVLLSVAFHFAGFLTSPYWQTRPAAREQVMQVDIADIPVKELPKIPRERIVEPAPAPRAAVHPLLREAAPQPVQPPPPPTREMIREKVASRGVLKMLSAGKPGDSSVGADPLSGIKIPQEIRVARGAPSANSYPVSRGNDEPGAARAKSPGIGKQVTVASRTASRSLSSQVFRTDAGLEGEISGGIDDESRSASAIAATVTGYRSGIKYAYNKELQKNPNLSGKITVAFVILPDGSVDSAEVRQSNVNWPPLEEAVLKKLRHWKFSKSKGASVRVVFPFMFHPEM
ncbi:MAG: TonB family protein [Deltaproteobacteria bacterium]|nr:TonB family protein [Deltaproteobacteria bacterium]